MNKPKILVIEDEEAFQRLFERVLGNQVVYLEAQTTSAARELFEANPDLALIALDACLGTRYINTLELLKEIRKTFKGPIVAISGIEIYRTTLIEAGCDLGCEKEELPRTIGFLLVLG